METHNRKPIKAVGKAFQHLVCKRNNRKPIKAVGKAVLPKCDIKVIYKPKQLFEGLLNMFYA